MNSQTFRGEHIEVTLIHGDQMTQYHIEGQGVETQDGIVETKEVMQRVNTLLALVGCRITNERIVAIAG